MENQKKYWDITIDAAKKEVGFNLKDLIKYKDLLFLFVKRDFVANFKQTILGPLWFVIQPLFQSLIIFFVFGKIAKFLPKSVDGMSFYLAGVTCWFFFSGNLTSTSMTFAQNAKIFGKVYFPRLIAPLSLFFSGVLKLTVQIALFLIVFIWAFIFKGKGDPNITILLTPLYFIHAGLLSMGLGLIISSLTTKYRDLKFLLQFGVQLLMYMSTVPYSLKSISDRGIFTEIVAYNPMSPIIEATRYAFLGSEAGTLNLYYYSISLIITILSLIIGVLVFNRVEKNFMDTV